MRKTFLNLMILCFFGIIPVFGQSQPKFSEGNKPADSGQNKASKQTGQLSSEYELQLTQTKKLLPLETDSWVVRIITTGGFSGGGLPTLTVVSNGYYYCGDNQTDQGKAVLPEILQSISPVVNALFLSDKTPKDLSSSAGGDEILDSYCKDCYQTQTFILRRENNQKIKTMRSANKSIVTSDSTNLNAVYQAVTKHLACQSEDAKK